jgi:hypothetical protein
MRLVSVLVSVLVALTLTACAASTAPPPFSAEQIRGATPNGRTYIFRMTEADGGVITRRVVFSDVSDETASIEAIMLDEYGEPLGESDKNVVTWEDLVTHASYPRDHTVISDASVEVPAGTYAAKLYTVTERKEGKQQVTRAWFAKDLPGAPVKHVVEVDGTPVATMELVEQR